MANESLQEIIQFELRSYGVTVQVNQAKDLLTVVVNRPADTDVDYPGITELLCDKLNSLNLEVEKYKILGRVEKQTKPEWQQLFDNPHMKKASGPFGFLYKKKG